MRLTGKKDLNAHRTEARARVDAILLPEIEAVKGPKFALYQSKAFAAHFGVGESILMASDDPGDIVDRFEALMSRVREIEAERQACQARIDNALNVLEIDEIVEGLRNERNTQDANGDVTR